MADKDKEGAVKEPAPSNDKEVGEMKRGDYMIHVYIQAGKQFKAASDTVSPMVEITCCGKKKYSQSKSDVATSQNTLVYWTEHIFFEPRNVEKAEIESSVISIRLLNKGLFKDELIGAYDFDITFVYFKDQHALQHQWVALSNPESENFSDITGLLKLSISVQGPGDEQVQLSDQVGPDTADSAVMMPASIKKEFKQLKFQFIQGEKLPKMDTFGTIDAYLTCTFFGKKSRTKAVTAKKDVCAIEQEIWLPIQWPLSTNRLIFKVFDEDKIVDEIVGSLYFNLKDLIEKCESNPDNGFFYWQNLYGSPMGYSGKVCDMMNDNPEFASAWKGRLLMHISCEESKHPEKKEIALEPEIKQAAIDQKFYEQQEFEIVAEVGMGIQMPGEKEYKIRICINDFKLDFDKPKEHKKSYCRWSLREHATWKAPYHSIDRLDRIYIYIMDGNHPICYWKGSVKDFVDPNPSYRWFVMKNDQGVGKVEQDYNAGLIQAKITVNHKQKNGALKLTDYPAWKGRPPRRLNAWKVRCFIYQCRDIPAADEDGSSDAYISVWNPDGTKAETKCIEDNLNPIFFETIEVYYDFDVIENAPPIVMNIWDKDGAFDADDFLGRCVVYLKDANYSTDDTIPRPTWHDIKIGFDESQPACGQILASFAVVADDFEFKTPCKYLNLSDFIPMKEYSVDLNVLGLRELQSFGLMPIKKPFIKFRIKSLLPPEKAQAVTNIQTDPKASGSNPNINTLLTFSVALPTDKLYCPRLACDVYDYIYKGMSQPLVGTFTIPMGDIMHEQIDDRKKTLEIADELIEFLTSQMNKSDDVLKRKVTQTLNPFLQDSTLVSNKSVKDFKAEQLRKKKLQESLNSNNNSIVESERDQEDNREEILLTDVNNTNNDQVPLVRQNDIQLEINNQRLSEVKNSQHHEQQLKAFEEELKSQKSGVSRKSTYRKGSTKGGVDQDKKDLMKRYKEQQNLVKEAKKLELAEKKKKDQEAMKAAGGAFYNNILIPHYEYDEELKYYTEVNIPPETMYKSIGYNDLQTVHVMMEGDDAEKRSKANSGKQSIEERFATDLVKDLAKQEDQARKTQITKKHYRKFYDDELEHNKDIFPKMPFHSIDVKRGQSRGLTKSWFSIFTPPKTDASGQVTNEKVVGRFKGRISVQNEEDKKIYDETKKQKIEQIIKLMLDIHTKMFNSPLIFTLDMLETQEQAQKFSTTLDSMGINHPDLLEFLKDQSYEELIKRQLLMETPCTVELYMLEGFDFAQRDIGSFSDPYLKIIVGDRVFDERENYILDEPNPKFYKRYQFSATFPGAPSAIIEAYDFDDLFGDDLIGKTIVDLDDRFFSPDWQAIEEKPIEYRQIYHPSTDLSQGVITMWVEIEQNQKANKQEQKAWDVSPEPIRDYEVRLSVMGTENVPCEDAEGTSDVFMKAYIDDKDKKETDTHYRCMNGKASFNYRLLYTVPAPRTNYLLVVQAWDRDLFKKNDYICEWTLDLEPLFANVRLTQKPVHLNKAYYDGFFRHKLPPGVKLEFDNADSFWMFCVKDGTKIKCKFDLRIFPGEQAKANPVGGQRSDPNQEPYLPPPVGRISFSLNPFKMLSQLIAPEYLRKFYCYCCCALCLVMCIAMLPMMLSQAGSSIMLSIFGLN